MKSPTIIYWGIGDIKCYIQKDGDAWEWYVAWNSGKESNHGRLPGVIAEKLMALGSLEAECPK